MSRALRLAWLLFFFPRFSTVRFVRFNFNASTLDALLERNFYLCVRRSFSVASARDYPARDGSCVEQNVPEN